MRPDRAAVAVDEPVQHVPGGRSILDELLTARQLADALQMRVSTVEEYARRGLLPSIKLGRHRRFVRSHVEDAISHLHEHAANRQVKAGISASCRRSSVLQ
jgi:excisionase family DNA binding protein